MFVFDFVAADILEEVIDWIYGKLIEALTLCFTLMDTMGENLFDMPWVEAITLFFSKFAWALYGVGLVVAVFEVAMEFQNGRVSIKDSLINMLKGLMAVSLFTIVPVKLYGACVSWEMSLAVGLTGISITSGWQISFESITNFLNGSDMPLGMYPNNILFNTILITLCAYALIKVFFGNLKRGGILLVQIAVGSLYMFSVPRGYMDGFRQWCKQVIAICLTAFLQTLILTAGLMIFKEHMVLGIGLMLSSAEVPRICGQFGIDTSTKVNVMSGVYAAQSVMNISKSIASAVAK